MKYLEEASLIYHGSMNQRSHSYLHGRGVSEDTVAYFRLGLVDNPLPGHEPYEGRLCIPYIKLQGTVSLKFRCMEDHNCKDIPKHSKYLSDGDQWLYNTNDIAHPGDIAAYFEGEPDTWIGHQCGFAAFGYPGTESFKGHPWWEDVSEGFSTVLIFADNDSSKEGNPGLRAAKGIKSLIPRARIVIPPDDCDTNEMFLQGGASALWEAAGLEWKGARVGSPRLQLVSA